MQNKSNDVNAVCKGGPDAEGAADFFGNNNIPPIVCASDNTGYAAWLGRI